MKHQKVICTAGIFVLLFLFGCKEDNLLPNQPPDTLISSDTINLSGQYRLNSTVRLSWYGTDPDGYVTGFEYTINNSDWYYTTVQDTIFRFTIDPGVDTADIVFKVRAIDNQNAADPEPAVLRIPLKNAPPVAAFETESFPSDTIPLVLTFRWNYSDPDGDNTVTKAMLKVNNSNWVEIDRNKRLVSLIAKNVKTTGLQDALLYYGTEKNPSSVSISGFVNGGNNTLYLKVFDLAGSESITDTAATVFVKTQNNDMLFLNGHNTSNAAFYTGTVTRAGMQYDFIDLAAGGGKYLPRFWNPTYYLLTKQYKTIFMAADQGLFTNPATGNAGLLLEFLAPVFQNFTDNGGKSFITASFPAGYDLSNIRGAYPIDSMSATSGQAVVNNDSSIYDPSAKLPELKPKNLVLGLDPFLPTADATILYRARLSAFGAWKGPNIVGVRRLVAGKTRQVFFSVELHLFNADATKTDQLFTTIFNTTLNE